MARDSDAIKNELAKNYEVTVDEYAQSLELFDFFNPIHKNREIVYSLGLAGKRFTFSRSCDIHWFSHPSNVVNLLAKKRIVRIHDLFPITNPNWFTAIQRRSFRQGLNASIATGSHFVANSDFTRGQLHDVTGTSLDDISVLSCNVDRLGEEKCGICEGCSYSTFNIKPFNLMVGTLEPRKNYIKLIEILSMHDAIHTVVIGRVGWKSSEIVKKFQFNGRIKHLGTVCDGMLREYYLNANAFVSLSLEEGFNLPASEARVFGTPRILSNIPIHRELHSDAILVDLEDCAGWAFHLSRVKGKSEQVEVFERRQPSMREELDQIINKIS